MLPPRPSTRVFAVAGGFLLLLWGLYESRLEIGTLRAALRVVNVKAHEESTKVKEEGRVVTVRKYAPPVAGAGGAAHSCKGVLVEERIERDPVTTTTAKEKSEERKETPVVGALGARRTRYAGVLLDPGVAGYAAGCRAGVTLWDRLDVGYSLRVRPAVQHGVEVGIRF